MSSFGGFGRTFTLTGRKKKKEEPKPEEKKAEEPEEEEDDDEDDEDADAFSWVFVAFMSDGTLQQYTNEMMDEEVARLKLGYLCQAKLLDDPPDTYEHAFQVKPEAVTSDTWILCPDSVADSEEWISVLTA